MSSEGLGPKDVISLVALAFSAISLVPVLYAYFRRYVANLDVFDRQFVIVGFSRFGSVISVPMTLRSWHFDLFVSQINLKVTSKRSAESRDFEMTLFRQETFATKAGGDGKLQSSTDGQIELARPFLLYEKSPQFMDVLFSNTQTRLKMSSQLEVTKALVHQISLAHASSGKSGPPDIVNDPRVWAALKELRQERFWEADSYLAEMKIATHRPTRIFSFSFRFCLSEKDIQQLEKNDLSIVIESLGRVPDQPLVSLYPAISKIE